MTEGVCWVMITQYKPVAEGGGRSGYMVYEEERKKYSNAKLI